MDELIDRLSKTPKDTSPKYPKIITIVTSTEMITLVEEKLQKEYNLIKNNFGKTFK